MTPFCPAVAGPPQTWPSIAREAGRGDRFGCGRAHREQPAPAFAVCGRCNDNLLGDEDHFLYVCSALNEERAELIAALRPSQGWFQGLQSHEKSLYMFSSGRREEIAALAQYLVKAM